MTDDERKAAAKAIDDAVKAAADKAKADAEGEAGPSLADLMTAIKGCADSMTAMSARMDALEAAGKGKDGEEDGDADPAGDDPVAAAVDARRRADAVTPEERQALAECQMRADAVALAFGERAPAPLVGENLAAFRVRCLLPYQPHSVAFKNLDLDKLAAAGGLDVAEKQIFADALAYSKSPERVAPGHLLMVEKKLDGGHIMRTFQGHPRSWMDDIAGPVRQYVTSGLGAGEGLLNNN
jgi:hypothetical protein